MKTSQQKLFGIDRKIQLKT